ncbi:methylated-DNA--[protein]-cysteine S-methyltransferase [Gordonia neofelifaecis]|uniref:Methylated-DNA--protein-cysteine methyltransferase n=1 Tax=Gordonia neofelifaecis NRRL B-59395 TaxID=644548 RepID=F1YHZ2_9ACTN|nr:methylated-DNA--[protein]-cysteine S-methyltransferase [Gordonia neofelifaecis]EGD55546.1 methylated-DNA--protein-cysteine methyltransferase [Gordonia neofelifaecis NRRL B-59395]
MTDIDRTGLFPVSDDDLSRLRAGLATAAVEATVLDVAYRTVDTPIGPLLLATTETGLVRVAFEREGFDAVLDALAATVSPRLLRAPRRLDAVAAELEEYFAGRRRLFDVPLDFRLSSGFRQRVQQYLPHIGYGTTQSYKEVATSVGNPNAVRAVGTACATNPLPVVVPCHRVLRADGGLGGYLGGVEAKTSLLTLEGAA